MSFHGMWRDLAPVGRASDGGYRRFAWTRADHVLREWFAGEKIARVLRNDPGMGVIRHVDAGYDEAIEVAERLDVRVPMREG